MDEETRERAIQLLAEWEENGVSFRIEEAGTISDTGEVVHEQRERLVLDGVHLFLFSPPEAAALRRYEKEIMQLLKEREANA